MVSTDTDEDSADQDAAASAWAALASLGAALVLAIAALFWLFGGSATNFNELALGAQTQSVYADYEGHKVHCGTFADAEPCLAPASQRRLGQAVIWLGNSQLHAINQLKPGQTTAAGLLARRYRPQGVEVLAFSQPNASLAEHLVMYEGLRQRIRPSVLVLPLVFDDTREGGIRQDVAKGLAQPAVKARIAQGPAGRRILALAGTLAAEQAAATDSSMQAKSETALTGALEQCCGWETLRLQARGHVFMVLFRTRNAVFGINPSSQRRKLPAVYNLNLAAYEQILASAKADGVQVVAYIAPLRGDAPRPYDAAEYQQFRTETAAIAARWGARYLDLEAAVPGRFWGLKDGTGADGAPELDFMHFQAPGHALLAARIEAAVKDLLK
jgi:hypothetical protein